MLTFEISASDVDKLEWELDWPVEFLFCLREKKLLLPPRLRATREYKATRGRRPRQHLRPSPPAFKTLNPKRGEGARPFYFRCPEGFPETTRGSQTTAMRARSVPRQMVSKTCSI